MTPTVIPAKMGIQRTARKIVSEPFFTGWNPLILNESKKNLRNEPNFPSNETPGPPSRDSFPFDGGGLGWGVSLRPAQRPQKQAAIGPGPQQIHDVQ